MITCHRRHLEERCLQRNYSLAEVMPCVVSVDGDMWTIDENHRSYPRQPKGQKAAVATTIEPEVPGPGTELKKLLSKIGIKAKPGCSCNRRAKAMNENGIEWCERNVPTIVSWLREEASRRKLPFIDTAGTLLVKRAIANAKRQAAASK